MELDDGLFFCNCRFYLISILLGHFDISNLFSEVVVNFSILVVLVLLLDDAEASVPSLNQSIRFF